MIARIQRIRSVRRTENSSNSAATQVKRSVPFGPPPLLEGEDVAAYDELLARVSEGVQPNDILEEIWVRDIVDLVWETLRLRRMKAAFFSANAHESLTVILRPLIDDDEQVDGEEIEGQKESEEAIGNNYLAKNWARRIPAAVKKVNTLLTQANLTMEAVNACTLSNNIDMLERVDLIIAGLENRRNSILREIDRHRESLARRLRQNLEQIEDADYKVVNTKRPKD
jgi:hypothetical protein